MKVFNIKLILSSFFVLGFISNNFAQKSKLSLNDAVMEQGGIFRPRRLSQLSFIPNSEDFVYLVEKGKVMIKSNPKKADSIVFLKVEDVSLVLSSEFKSFSGYEWRSKSELILRTFDSYFLYNVDSKKGQRLFTIPQDAEDVKVDIYSEQVAYTIGNDLFLISSKNKGIVTVRNNENPGEVSGKSIARNEFGIADGLFWSPDGQNLAFYHKDESDVAEYPLLDVTTTPGSLKMIRYPMAGQKSEKPKVGIFNIALNKTVWISPRGEKDAYLTNLSWTPDGKHVLIAEINRDQNAMSLDVYDATSGTYLKTLLTETDDKWVEPEHAAFFPSKTSSNFIWISEKDGFNNLYYYNFDGKLITQLTSNKFVVKNIVTSLNNGKTILFTATGTSPLNTMYYSVGLDKKQQLLTIEEGTHNCVFSQTGTTFVDAYSSHLVPAKTCLKNAKGKLIRNLMVSPDKLTEYQIGTAEISQLQSSDGSILYTRLIKPSNFDATKKYPVLVYVYGGPHAQMITNSYLDGASLWMYWMAEQGYLIYTVDNRGSGERGKVFEQQIHRQLGEVEMQDQLLGVAFLKSLPYVDGNRLAVHGWSFGGFMTNSLMMRSPETFKVGVAGGPVTDWKYYEIMYGERYMDRPEQNVEGYKKSSLFSYTNQLKGDLLLIHGTVDDVVVMQHNYALVKDFVEKGIQVDFFPYPMHPHNVSGKDRVHLMTKVLNYIIENNQ